ncbi:MAG: N-acetyltransferase [Alphaproteobacteria bacterium]|nr:MAG: N-acetyltransferase [Alphaproteobacteria bacterium]
MKTLTTQRLVLRPFKMSDAPSVATLIGNYDVAKMLSRVPYPYALSDAQGFLKMQIEESDPRRNVFAIEVKDGPDVAVGAIGVHGENEPDGQAELGYWIGEPYWGKGYVSEAARAVVDFAFTDMGLHTIVAGHFVGNLGSRKILLKLGFEDVDIAKRHSAARGQDVDCANLVLPRAKWESAK